MAHRQLFTEHALYESSSVQGCLKVAVIRGILWMIVARHLRNDLHHLSHIHCEFKRAMQCIEKQPEKRLVINANDSLTHSLTQTHVS